MNSQSQNRLSRRLSRWVGPGAACVALGLGAVSLYGCDPDPEAPVPAESPTPADAGRRAAPPPPAPAAIDAPELADIARRIAEPAAAYHAAAEKRREAALAKVDEGAKVVRGLYEGGKLLFYKGDGNLSEDGQTVMKLLAQLERHGVATRPYKLERVDEATAGVVAAFAAERKALLAAAKTPDAARVAAVGARWMRSGKGTELELMQAGGDKLTPLDRKRLADGLDAVRTAAEATRPALWKADVEIARCVVRYFVDFLYARPAHPHETTSPATIRRLADKNADELLARLGDKRGAIANEMRAAWPSHPQYAALLGAVDRYAGFVADGDWDKLPSPPGKVVKKGARGAFVTALRARLAKEGYTVGSGDVFDATLVEAVERFQRRHQLTDDGEVSRSTIRELDVSAAMRLRQLRLALERMREANGRDPETFFVWVNVAGQFVRVYDGGKVIREHRVIVGKDNEDIDYEARIKGRINRTKLFSAKMSKVTLAPRWYPTPRVVDLELGPALAKDPDYFEKHGYVSEMNADGSERVYQKSGPTNLLGVVKFQFPNKHAIYMHDTPSRHLFKKSRRAYSHGCIRLENPVAMANFVLGRDKGWNKSKIKKILDEREEKIVMLKKPIPVHIDYVTATVDEDGEVQFWGDVYGYDQAFFTGQLPVEEVEEYKAASTRGLL